jgi:hypothetical protein
VTAADIKRLRRMLNERGFYGTLRLLAEGADVLGREVQISILREFGDRVRNAKRERELGIDRPRTAKQTARDMERDKRLAKLDALANDRRGNENERGVAKAMAAKLRANRGRR